MTTWSPKSGTTVANRMAQALLSGEAVTPQS